MPWPSSHGRRVNESGRIIESVMSKASELREMSDEQLELELRETRQELFRLRFQAAKSLTVRFIGVITKFAITRRILPQLVDFGRRMCYTRQQLDNLSAVNRTFYE